MTLYCLPTIPWVFGLDLRVCRAWVRQTLFCGLRSSRCTWNCVMTGRREIGPKRKMVYLILNAGLKFKSAIQITKVVGWMTLRLSTLRPCPPYFSVLSTRRRRNAGNLLPFHGPRPIISPRLLISTTFCNGVSRSDRLTKRSSMSNCTPGFGTR